VNPSLERYADSHLLFPAAVGPTGTQQDTVRVLVPLCGKTVDLAYLARHPKVKQVIGVEGIGKAIEEFASENPELMVVPVEEREKSSTQQQPFKIWTGKTILMLEGDFLELADAARSGQVDAIWDRAALVAVDPSVRELYVETHRRMLKPGGRILLSTYVRRSGDPTKGPPFSIDEDEVRRLYGDPSWVESVELLDVHGAAAFEPWYKALALWFRMGKVDEKIFLITAKT